MGKAVIGLDIGTSSAKAVLYDSEKGVIHSERAELSQKVSDGKTINPNLILSIVTKLLSNVTRKNKGLKIESVGMSALFPSLVALDSKGKPLTKILTWMDDRAASIVNEFKKNRRKSLELHERTGCVVHESYPLWKILWLKNNNKDIFLKTDKFISLSEYLTYKLTGKFVVSNSIASTTSLFNTHSKDWDDYALSMIDVGKEKLSELNSPFHSEKILKNLTVKIGTTPETSLVLGAGDGVLCHIGSGCIKEGIMSSTLGTSSALRLTSDKPITKNPKIWCYNLDDKRWIFGSATNAGWSSLKWFRKNANFKSFKNVENTLSKTPIGGPIFLPFLDGERGPDYNQGMKASFIGLTSKDNAASLYRSVLEGILFNLYSCYEIIIHEAGKHSQIRASGGMVNSDLILQMHADIFGKEIVVPHVKEASSVGAAIMALKSIGEISDVKEVKVGIEKIFYPDDGRHDKYMKRYDVYKKIYSGFSKQRI